MKLLVYHVHSVGYYRVAEVVQTSRVRRPCKSIVRCSNTSILNHDNKLT